MEETDDQDPEQLWLTRPRIVLSGGEGEPVVVDLDRDEEEDGVEEDPSSGIEQLCKIVNTFEKEAIRKLSRASEPPSSSSSWTKHGDDDGRKRSFAEEISSEYMRSRRGQELQWEAKDEEESEMNNREFITHTCLLPLLTLSRV